jgi:hypothetical protein
MARKIIQRGQISFEVANYDSFYEALQDQLTRTGGYIGQLETYRSSGNLSSAKITVRIPAEGTSVFTSWLREQGKIVSENITADDVSEEYYDLQARLENARKFEARLMEMVKSNTGDLDDLVLLEEKLSAMREQIEQMQGRVRYLDRLVSMATLTLNVQVQNTTTTPTTPGFGTRAAHVWKESTGALKDASQAFVLLIVAIVPWILPICLAAALLWILVRTGMKLWSLRYGG